jgi:hypothetical protein
MHGVKRIRVDASSSQLSPVTTSPCDMSTAFETPEKEATTTKMPEAQSLSFEEHQFDEFTTDDDDDESVHSDQKQYVVGSRIEFWKSGQCISDSVTGRILGRKNKEVLRYVTAQNGQVPACDLVLLTSQLDTPRGVTPQPQHAHTSDDDSDADVIDAQNPSAVYAARTRENPTEITPSSGLCFELGDKESAPMAAMWKLFQQPKYRGGFLARSLFCEAAKEKNIKVLPKPWSGGTSLKSTVAEKRVQEQEWLNWTEDDRVNEWVRKRIFSIIIANPRPDLTVTWKGRSTQLAIHGDASIVVTESHRCRIAHLAVDPQSKLLINLIYCGKNERSDLDDSEMRVTQLWAEVARDFVNAQSWIPYADTALPIYSDIDVTACPASPGLDGATIKEIWMALRTDWSRLQVAIKSKTGASVMATGSIYDNVWNHFVCGAKMVFAHKVTTMYCFELWDKCNRSAGLPQWCNRTLPTGTAVSAGVGSSSESLSTPQSKATTQHKDGKEGKETPQTDHSARLCSLLETLVQTSSHDAGKFQAFDAELRALQTAQALIPAHDELHVQITDRIKALTRKLLAGNKSDQGFSPLSPS